MITSGSRDQDASAGQEPVSGQGPKDEFALVCYLPGALGVFLDRLRTELVTDCTARSHVTLLPPRPLNGCAALANQQLRLAMPTFAPFEVELGDVAVFELTRVVYLELLRGQHELHEIHRILNAEALHFKEPFDYHPHVTLAQGPSVFEHTEDKLKLARDRWDSFRGPRKFLVESVTFVQNGGSCGWLDLDELPVGSATLEPSIL